MNSIAFPPFYVMDGSWGLSNLSISDATGLSILCKKSGSVFETWPWNEMSHATIKNYPRRIVQLKKFSGVKKQIVFASFEEMDRFQRVLKNSRPVKVATNKRFQRKLVILQAGIESYHHAPVFLQANHLLPPPVLSGLSAPPARAQQRRTEASNDHSEVALSNIPAPPPPPMPPVMSKLVVIKPQAKPKTPLTNAGSYLSEMQTKFAGGVLMPSKIKEMVANQSERAIPWYLIKEDKKEKNKASTEQVVESVVEEVVESIPEPIREPIQEPILEHVAQPEQLSTNDNNNNNVIPPALPNWPSNRAERSFRIWTADSQGAQEDSVICKALRAAVRRDLHFYMKDKLSFNLKNL